MEQFEFALHIGTAFVLGVAIGIERQFGQHPAGLRTNTLVCIGSAIFVSLGNILVQTGDPTRIAGQVVSGVGFLGGGAILREGVTIRGMNTAATIWCSAAVGTLAGAGLLPQALIATLTILIVHTSLWPLVRWIDERAKKTGTVESCFRCRVTCQADQAALIRSICLRHINSQSGMLVQGISTKDVEHSNQCLILVDIHSAERNDKYLNDLVQRLSIEISVSSASWERVL